MRRLVCTWLLKSAVIVVVLFGVLSADKSVHARTSFDVKRDGFSISNAPGYCFAMAAFSRWYYLNNKGNPPLRSALSRRIQRKIAKTLQNFYSSQLVGIQAKYCNQCSSDPTESFRRFIIGLMMGEPRIVLLMNRSSRGVVLHAVLAYQWMPEQKLIKIYDPNYQNDERYIDLENRQYTSLDITYNAICFPEVLDENPALIRKMESLYYIHVARNAHSRRRAQSY